METRYFACTQCRDYISAGRLCYIWLERHGPLIQGHTVNILQTLNHPHLWRFLNDDNPSNFENHLQLIHQFLQKHQSHPICWLGNQTLPEDFDINWLDISQPTSTPRFYVEVLKMKSWDFALKWRESLGQPWPTESQKERFRQAFEHHLQKSQNPPQ